MLTRNFGFMRKAAAASYVPRAFTVSAGSNGIRILEADNGLTPSDTYTFAFSIQPDSSDIGKQQYIGNFNNGSSGYFRKETSGAFFCWFKTEAGSNVVLSTSSQTPLNDANKHDILVRIKNTDAGSKILEVWIDRTAMTMNTQPSVYDAMDLGYVAFPHYVATLPGGAFIGKTGPVLITTEDYGALSTTIWDSLFVNPGGGPLYRGDGSGPSPTNTAAECVGEWTDDANYLTNYGSSSGDWAEVGTTTRVAW